MSLWAGALLWFIWIWLFSLFGNLYTFVLLFFFSFPCSLEPVVYWFKAVSEYQEWNARLAIVTDKVIPAASFQSLPSLPFFPYKHPGAPWAAQQVLAAGALSAQERCLNFPQQLGRDLCSKSWHSICHLIQLCTKKSYSWWLVLKQHRNTSLHSFALIINI